MDPLADTAYLLERVLLGYIRAQLAMDAKASWVMSEHLKGPLSDLDKAINDRGSVEELERGELDRLLHIEDEPEPPPRPNLELTPDGLVVMGGARVQMNPQRMPEFTARSEEGTSKATKETTQVQKGTADGYPRWSPEHNRGLSQAQDTIDPEVPRCG